MSAPHERRPRRWSRGELAVAGTFAILVAAAAAFVLGLAGLKCDGDAKLLVCDHTWDTVNAILVVASGACVSGGAAASVWTQRVWPLASGVILAFAGFTASAVIGGLHQ
jgi:hypothetical protein